MDAPGLSRSDKIAQLNDHLRRTFSGGKVMMTTAVNSLDPDTMAEVLSAVRAFDTFDGDNDSHREHDMAFFDVKGERYFFKVDLYEEPDVKSANGEPVVTRVLTIMLAEEY